MRSARSWWLGLVGLAFLACDDGDDPVADGALPEAGLLVDLGEGGAGGGAGGMGGGAGGMGGGAGGMGGGAGGIGGGVGGMGGGGPGVRDLETCPDICNVYEECGRLDDIWDGSYDVCQRACDEGSSNERWRGYRSCMQITPCDRLQECVVPARPLPGCAAVCDAAAACEAEFRLPGGLPEFADCAAACADGTAARHLAECGGRLVDEGICDEPAFALCLLERRASNCLDVCTRRADCDAGVDVVDCALACLAPEADPLAQRRIDRLRTCVRQSATCEALAACGQDAAPVAEIAALCATNAGSACPLFDGDACLETAGPVVRRLAEGAAACLTEGLTEACADPVVGCFQSAAGAADSCREHCEISSLCDLLPPGVNELDCRTACRQAVEGDDPAAADPYLGWFECLSAATCDGLETCQGQSAPEVRCAAHCAAEAECAERDAAACAVDCQARFSTRRMQAELACGEAAAGCPARARCVAPPPPDCAGVCGPQVACELSAPAACQTTCDDADFAGVGDRLELTVCLNATERCSARAECLNDPSGARACLAWCALEHRCAQDDPEALAACAIACAQDGVSGPAGLDFAGAEACLQAAGPRADCAELTACVPAEPLDYCAAVCAEATRCGLDEIVGCPADCPAEVDVEAGVCVLNALRRSAGCAPVAECLGVEVPPAPQACQALCAAQRRCDEDVDAFLCERQCVAAPEAAAIGARCAALASCEELPLCLAAPAEPPAGCAATCDTVGACADLIGEADGALYPDAEACRIDCAGRAALAGERYPGDLAECVAEAACDPATVVECVEDPRSLCVEGYQAVVACGFDFLIAPAGQDPFVADCEGNLAADPATTTAQLECMIAAAANMACFDIIACLLPF